MGHQPILSVDHIDNGHHQKKEGHISTRSQREKDEEDDRADEEERRDIDQGQSNRRGHGKNQDRESDSTNSSSKGKATASREKNKGVLYDVDTIADTKDTLLAGAKLHTTTGYIHPDMKVSLLFSPPPLQGYSLTYQKQQWEEVRELLAGAVSKPVVHTVGSSPFGSTLFYGHHNVIFQVIFCHLVVVFFKIYIIIISSHLTRCCPC